MPTPGCHFWVGALADDGYRRFTADGRTVGASRFPVDRAPRPLPPRVVVMHRSCDERSYTRLDHLRAGEPDREPGHRSPAGPQLRLAAHRPGRPAWDGRPVPAIRAALAGGYHPQRLQAALAAGDPRADWAVLF